jgi:indolepyruvate ferredoxin oxidoreductase, beta subunit
METVNFLITGVGGQGTVLASELIAAVGLAAGYDVKKSDLLGLSVRGGGVIGHCRWGEKIHSPIVPEGRVDFLIAFEILEGLRWLNQLKPEGTILMNLQEIHPVTVTSGIARYPNREIVDAALEKAAGKIYRVPAVDMAVNLGNSRVLNVVLLGVLSGLLDIDISVWEGVLKERVPSKYITLNIKALHTGRSWVKEVKERA